MALRSVLIVLCLTLLTGCYGQSLQQRSDTIDAINGKLGQLNYNKTYIFSTFGFPYSRVESTANGVKTEIWTYKTNMSKIGLLKRKAPHKSRFMKVTMTNNIVSDITFE